ncbi:SDR family NAD(P)-dependent oxidoreductase [Thorsellia anophelis]|uniref:3-hydroxy acid dehydrogenase / malonic semialdehyde reductase n=1 Tax=Thorsellia anophelis DSM 18579 TaxID=1123402 RepID=A0A1I0CKM5_9GAMM|nr:SDR family NAD(P)-dependent oxidoreductase [Thorsellia anophelis]SET19726.1 3-hydroxy acid dehydrogenase / malonic semialdehyde reductase [Thorsellia anophelis DSM 18579]
MNVFITGVSSGFGKAIAEKFIAEGHTVVGTARRVQRLNELKASLGDRFIPYELDVIDEANTKRVIIDVMNTLGNIDVVINNAGISMGTEKAQDAILSEWHTAIDTNIKGVVNVTHSILPYLIEQGFGLIINMGSTAGNYAYAGGNVYGGSKAFLKQFSINLRVDLHGTGVRVTNIEPGLVGGTEFSVIRYKGDAEKANSLYATTDPLMPDDISETVYWIATLPKHVNINSIEMMPVTQSPAGLQVHSIS